MTLGVGLTVLVLFLTLAQLATSLAAGPVREIVREGLIITGSVAMWRPLEIFLYEWWPIRADARLHDRLSRMTVRVRRTGGV